MWLGPTELQKREHRSCGPWRGWIGGTRGPRKGEGLGSFRRRPARPLRALSRGQSRGTSPLLRRAPPVVKSRTGGGGRSRKAHRPWSGQRAKSDAANSGRGTPGDGGHGTPDATSEPVAVPTDDQRDMSGAGDVMDVVRKRTAKNISIESCDINFMRSIESVQLDRTHHADIP